MTLNDSLTSVDESKQFDKVQTLLGSEKPFFIGRLSGNETAFCGNEIFKKQSLPSTTDNLRKVAGIYFSSNKNKDFYIEKYSQSVRSCNLLANFPADSKIFELNKNFNRFLEISYSDLPQIHNRCVEPYYFMGNTSYNFSKCIEGKKILIVSSHLESIKKQIHLLSSLFRRKIFSGNRFVFLKPPSTYGENHLGVDWSVYWKSFTQEIAKLDFDLALLSCGGYGMITSAFIREELQKSVIYVGGALQLWFGIKGKRWDQHPIISTFYNENWIRAAKSEIPRGSEQVENSCYW
tara:strand:+ start:528 stop:1403 length:876 start_codon:yes stop_codon:yes gene_type:complete